MWQCSCCRRKFAQAGDRTHDLRTQRPTRYQLCQRAKSSGKGSNRPGQSQNTPLHSPLQNLCLSSNTGHLPLQRVLESSQSPDILLRRGFWNHPNPQRHWNHPNPQRVLESSQSIPNPFRYRNTISLASGYATISDANVAEEKLLWPGIEPTTFWLKDRHATSFAKELSPLARAVITQTSHRTPYYIHIVY